MRLLAFAVPAAMLALIVVYPMLSFAAQIAGLLSR